MAGKYKRIEVDGDISDEMLIVAFNNSYRIITKEATYTEIANQTEGDVILLAHDPTNKKVSLKDLDDILVYYEIVEYYERCSVIKKIIEKRNKKKG